MKRKYFEYDTKSIHLIDIDHSKSSLLYNTNMNNDRGIQQQIERASSESSLSILKED